MYRHSSVDQSTPAIQWPKVKSVLLSIFILIKDEKTKNKEAGIGPNNETTIFVNCHKNIKQKD